MLLAFSRETKALDPSNLLRRYLIAEDAAEACDTKQSSRGVAHSFLLRRAASALRVKDLRSPPRQKRIGMSAKPQSAFEIPLPGDGTGGSWSTTSQAGD